ncbi:hypothetical protein CR513_55544, partial [Mucuna pruriens]
MIPHKDNHMVMSVVVIEYKVERVLVNQESLANVLYWTTFQKMGLLESKLEECPSTLISLSGKQIEIRGVIHLETTFEVGPSTRTITIKFMVINARTSYNIILGHPTLNKLRAIVSTACLCMKDPVEDKVGVKQADQQVANLRVRDNKRGWKAEVVERRAWVHFLDLDPCLDQEDIRP